MQANLNFPNSKGSLINIKCPDFNDIKHNSFLKEEPFLFEDSDLNDFVPQSEKNIEQIIPLIFGDLSNYNTNNDSNQVINLFENYCKPVKEKKVIFDINDKEDIQQKIRKNIFLKRPFKEKKIIGRKTKSNNSSGEHNKFSDDNLIRKCKHIILDSIWKFINQKIRLVYSKESKIILKKKQLFKLGQNQVEKSKAEYNKLFINKCLEDIFSEDISSKYSRHNPEHNKDLIKSLVKEKDETKRLIFQNIFKLTFLDCLQHFRGSCFRKELDGMNTLDNYCLENDFGNNAEEYKNILKIFFDNFEKIVMEKKSRNKKKKKTEEKNINDEKSIIEK